MKSIFHLITTINRGGAENQLLVLASEQRKQGFEVHVVYLKGEPELKINFELSGVVVHSELATRKPVMQPIYFRKLIKDKNAIVHAHLPRAELVALFTFAKFEFFNSRHNAEPFFPGAPKMLSNNLSRIVCARSTKTIAISNAVKQYLLQRGELKKSAKIEVVLYGYQPKIKKDLLRENVEKSKHRLGTISRLTDQKDIPTMLHAFAEYKIIYPTSSLSILGSGPLESELNLLANQLGVADSVHFLGRSSYVYEFLDRIDVFILTSKYEGFGMVLLEAIDAGVPIVASNNSAIPEVLGLDFPGLCSTGDSLEFFQRVNELNNPSYKIKVLAAQAKRLQLFEAEPMCRKISTIYASKVN